ncbi:MAG: P-II family nitrogen regulator [Roseburia sp.]|nr:P-II family nitrogen regulator [Roseburia sp.]
MTKYELILCVVNTGFTETVMEAAKEKGARGGTVFHARGTANKEAEEFFHITIQPDKEVVMILVPNEIKDDVLHAVYQAAGLKTAGQGIAFSVPVNDVVGIGSATDKTADKTDKTDTAEQPVQPQAESESGEVM